MGSYGDGVMLPKDQVRRSTTRSPPPERDASSGPVPASPVVSAPSESNTSHESDERPIKQPRHFVLKRFQAWLDETGLAFVAIDDVKRTTPAVQPFINGLDFIVLRDESKLLVTVRPHLQAKHLDSMRELVKLFGSPYQPIRFWPVDGPAGWKWKEHAVFETPSNGPSTESRDQVTKPATKSRRRKTEAKKSTPAHSPSDLSPIMEQYQAAKDKHRGMMLLFRNVAK